MKHRKSSIFATRTYRAKKTVNSFLVKLLLAGSNLLLILFTPSLILAEEQNSKIDLLLERAERAISLGHYQRAISYWQQIIQSEELESESLALIHNNIASVYWHRGTPGKAVKQWQESLEIYRQQQHPSPRQLAATLTDQARAYNDLGQPRFSIPLLREAISITDAQNFPELAVIAYLALGNARTIQADYTRAIDAYQKSLKSIIPLHRDLAVVVWNNLSQAHRQQATVIKHKALATEEEGETVAASRLWQAFERERNLAFQAAQTAVEIGGSSQTLAQAEALIQKARLFNDDSAARAEAILSTLPDSYRLVYAAIALGRLTNSDSSLLKAVEVARRIKNPRVMSFASGALGHYYEQQQQDKLALSWTKIALVAAQQAQAPDSLYQWDWQAARIYNATGKTEAAIEAYQRAIASLQSIRRDLAQTKGDPLLAFQNDLEPIYRGLIQLLLSSNDSQHNLKQALQTKDLLLLNELENFFADDCFELETYTEADRLAYLKQTNTAVVNTIIDDDKTYIIWLFPNGQFKKYALDISKPQLENLITQWRFDLENKENDDYLSLSQQLYKLLFSPEIKSDLEVIKPKNLIFINDGILRNVPMAALHDGQKFLVEDYAVINSLGLNIQIKQPLPSLEKAVAFGLTAGVNQFPPLPYVKQELEKLGSLVDEEQFLNNEFTKSNFKQQVESNKFSLVHVATHGRFGGTTENTFLQAYQSQISLKELEETLSNHNTSFPHNPIQLLVLSACDTAANNPRATIGMSGVAVRAGVSNVLGSLWSVNDRQIVLLIDGFYNYLIREGLSQWEALRQAQLDLIRSPDYHPSNWSSMILLQN